MSRDKRSRGAWHLYVGTNGLGHACMHARMHHLAMHVVINLIVPLHNYDGPFS